MKERPILFSGPMVRAILEGRKTQTRRICDDKWQAVIENCHDMEIVSGKLRLFGDAPTNYDGEVQMNDWVVEIPLKYGQPGDNLWVKETFRVEELDIDSLAGRAGTDGIRFCADGKFKPIENTRDAAAMWVKAYDGGRHQDHWRPSIFMPRWASRITLKIVLVRLERLQSISESDAKAEGVNPSNYIEMKDGSPCYSLPYQTLWNAINGTGSWESNPWVWVLEFKKL